MGTYLVKTCGLACPLQRCSANSLGVPRFVEGQCFYTQGSQSFEFTTGFGVPSISAPHTATLPPREPTSAWTLTDSCNCQKCAVEMQLQ
jgi:hypothetical protein